MHRAPDFYRPQAVKKSAAIESYLSVHDALLPSDPLITASSLWHSDLHVENVIVDANDSTRIVSSSTGNLLTFVPSLTRT